MRRRDSPVPARSGMSLIELVVAVGLSSILMVALFQLLDVTLDLWSKGEVRRMVVEESSAVSDLFASDLRGLHNGQQGDLLAEWIGFDTGGGPEGGLDGVLDRRLPRVRLVRQAPAAELARLIDETLGEGEVHDDPLPRHGLVEVAWSVQPLADPPRDGQYEGVLMRGVRLLDGPQGSFFDPESFAADGRFAADAIHEVTTGVLWMGLAFATQATVVHDDWGIGTEADEGSGSWDAWNRRRPDLDVHPWNEPGAWMPRVEGRPLLPRRVRLELELERARDRLRRARTLAPIEAQEAQFRVTDGDRIPRHPDAHVLVGGEWMRVLEVRGDRVRVQRGARATAPIPHEAGLMVHWGTPVVTEVPIDLYMDDWNL